MKQKNALIVWVAVLSLTASQAIALGDCEPLAARPQNRDQLLASARARGPEALNFASAAVGRQVVDHILDRSYGLDLRAMNGSPPALRCRAEIERQGFMLLVDLRNTKFGIGPDPDFPPVRYRVRMAWLQQQCATESAAVTAVLHLVEDTSAAFTAWLDATSGARQRPQPEARRTCSKDFG